jgi:uncharacterized protein (DUF302 family)
MTEDSMKFGPLPPALGLCALILAQPALSDDFISVEVRADFADVVFMVEQAITNRGLVVDHVSHVGAMLARTKQDTGGAKDLFTAAEIFAFCSAAVSREVMEADLRNVQYCPYTIHVYQPAQDDAPVIVGYREFAPASMRPANYLLQQIVAEAAYLP